MVKLVGVVFAGGNGTRLWPLSTAERPKQYSLHLEGRSPFQNAIQALVRAGANEIVACISCRHLDLAMEQIREIRQPNWPRVRIVAENFAIGTAAVYASIVDLYPPETKMVFLPADAWFLHPERFSSHIQQLNAELQEGAIMLGAPPWFISHQLGYVVARSVGADVDWAQPIKFVQYPTAEQLHELARLHKLTDHHVLWNTAITIANAGFWHKLMELDQGFINPIIRWKSHADIVLCDNSRAPDDLQQLRPGVDLLYIQPNLSKFMVAPHHSGWCDLGTFQSLARVCPENQQSVCTDTVVGITNGEGRFVVASSEGMISAPRANFQSGSVDQLRDLLKQHTLGAPEQTFEARRWGYFRVLHQGEYHRVKELVIFPGCSTSMQRHRERGETWFVKEGTLTVGFLTDVKQLPSNPEVVPEGSHLEIGIGEWHQLSNQEDSLLRILEVWHGPSMSEYDIERQGQSEPVPGE